MVKLKFKCNLCGEFFDYNNPSLKKTRSIGFSTLIICDGCKYPKNKNDKQQ